ncbi:camp-dependent protein kinase regulatory subunit [Nadsonia fulvescens var. elongata DSM 6958]|uniref:cAMP-dependent protein kinase regulatory subunit n=1 Tax=Nadsonia fulvescens var. elongata DSM 6958 TaxID=857566 RepID=A0A1E3PQM4_9ASCO|nr:camp-dependent protein kinase regulatory subunit [Nadsonia fulvescens var. elongata DSM 6958]
MSSSSDFTADLAYLDREIKTKQPQDIIQFCANYFNNKLEQQRKEVLSRLTSSPPSSSSPNSSLVLTPTQTAPTRGDSPGPHAGSANVNTFQPSYTNSPASNPASSSSTPSSGPSFFKDPNYNSSLDPNITTTSHVISSSNAGSALFPRNFDANRRVSVSAESMNPHTLSRANQTWKPTLKKALSEEQIQRIAKSIENNFLFTHLDDDSLKQVIGALEEKKYNAGEKIIVQGDEGDFFYIIEKGNVDIFVNGVKVSTLGPPGSFGELALMYNSPRAATVQAATQVVVWALDRATFKTILLEGTSKKRSMYEQFLKEVPILRSLNNYERCKLADALNSETYEPNQVIIREGDIGEQFYIIECGEAIVEKKGVGKVKEYSKGDYFGEIALIQDVPRQASVISTTKLKVVTLEKSAFQRLLGPAVEIMKRSNPIQQ